MIEATTRELIKLFRQHIDPNTQLSAGSIVEISQLPVVVLNGPLLAEKKRLMRDPERITAIDEETGEAVSEVPPRWYDLRFDVNITCASDLEIVRMAEKCSRVNQGHPLLTAISDERERQYLWRWNRVPDVVTVPNVSQVYQMRGELIVYDVEVYSGIREVYRLIEKVIVNINREKIEVQL